MSADFIQPYEQRGITSLILAFYFQETEISILNHEKAYPVVERTGQTHTVGD